MRKFWNSVLSALVVILLSSVVVYAADQVFLPWVSSGATTSSDDPVATAVAATLTAVAPTSVPPENTPTPTATSSPTPTHMPTAESTSIPLPTPTRAPAMEMRFSHLIDNLYQLLAPNVISVTLPNTLSLTTKGGIQVITPQWITTGCVSSSSTDSPECGQGATISARFVVTDPIKIGVNTNIMLVTSEQGWVVSGQSFVLQGEYPLPNQPISDTAPIAAFNFVGDHQKWWITEQNCKAIDWDSVPFGNNQWGLELRGPVNGQGDQCARTLEAIVDMRTSQPEFTSAPAPYDWRGKDVSCLVFVPNRFADKGLSVKIGISDQDWRNEFSPAVSVTANFTGQWHRIHMHQGNSLNTQDDKYDPSHIIGWKVRLEATPGASINANGPIYYTAACRVD